MTDVDALYGELKQQLQALGSPLFAFAEQQVRKRGGFLPFGAVLERSGEIALHASSTSEESASSAEVLPILYDGVRATVGQREVAAVAVCEWVRITPEDGEQTDAVKVLVEHERGLTIAFYVPCRRRVLFGWRFDGMLARPAQPEVQPSWRRPAAQQRCN